MIDEIMTKAKAETKEVIKKKEVRVDWFAHRAWIFHRTLLL
jgi:hypothetical protein